ncbi:MAG: hypothetical protein ACRCX8_04960 [Sarcina sp.]
MIEMYEGKLTVDVGALSDLGRHYLVQFKEELNKYIAERTKKPKDTRSNMQVHRDNINGR